MELIITANKKEGKISDITVIFEQVLKHAQIIKGVSYYLGYPLAVKIMEKFGLDGIRLTLQSAVPLKAEYFVNPELCLNELGIILPEQMEKSEYGEKRNN